MKIYECENPACALGSRKDNGNFTGGITAEQKALLSGDPLEGIVEEGEFGEGFCPTCGEKGKPTDLEFVVRRSKEDPYQELHNEIDARVRDENDPLTARGAQRALLDRIAETSGEEGAPDA